MKIINRSYQRVQIELTPQDAQMLHEMAGRAAEHGDANAPYYEMAEGYFSMLERELWDDDDVAVCRPEWKGEEETSAA